MKNDLYSKPRRVNEPILFDQSRLLTHHLTHKTRNCQQDEFIQNAPHNMSSRNSKRDRRNPYTYTVGYSQHSFVNCTRKQVKMYKLGSQVS
jgi:hypothetical protein